MTHGSFGLTSEIILIRANGSSFFLPKLRLEEVAQLMLKYQLGGLPGLENGKLVGIITTSDVLKAFLSLAAVRRKPCVSSHSKELSPLSGTIVSCCWWHDMCV